jgi:peptidyl-prolyl cis-trans isomerase B (cyclophilin B)
MANAGPNTNGSQFFMVYKDTQLPPEYTVFGKIQQDGLATLDKIAKGGVAGGGQDGQPTIQVTIKSVRLD